MSKLENKRLMTCRQWERDFEQMEGPLTKCLLLIAVMSMEGLINREDAEKFKQFLLCGEDTDETRSIQVLASF